jgi:hypothetical protein
MVLRMTAAANTLGTLDLAVGQKGAIVDAPLLVHFAQIGRQHAPITG